MTDAKTDDSCVTDNDSQGNPICETSKNVESQQSTDTDNDHKQNLQQNDEQQQQIENDNTADREIETNKTQSMEILSADSSQVKNEDQTTNSKEQNSQENSSSTTRKTQADNHTEIDMPENLSNDVGQTNNSHDIEDTTNNDTVSNNLSIQIHHQINETDQSQDFEEKEKAKNLFEQAIKNDSYIDYKKFDYTIDQNKSWLNLQFHNNQQDNGVVKPHEIKISNPPSFSSQDNEDDDNLLNRIKGSIIGMALGDALGAHVEFRPHSFLQTNPVTDLGSGGTWGLNKGQFTDDTSMALCLANSLIICQHFVPYDQLVRYKWWYKHGYMSSTGECFDIGNATRESIEEFNKRQQKLLEQPNTTTDDLDYPSNRDILKHFNVYCSSKGVAGNGALMRLAPVPLFFFRSPVNAVEYSGISGHITHGDEKSYDACRYYGALIVAALYGFKKEQLLDNDFYSNHFKLLFHGKKLHLDVENIAKGSYKKRNGYEDGIRGTGYIVNALEAALWALWSTETFEKGALAAVNLGDDTDTTAAIYGQLAGAIYGYKELPSNWTQHLYAREFLENLCEWIAYEGKEWHNKQQALKSAE